jgi:hypothetical protein
MINVEVLNQPISDRCLPANQKLACGKKNREKLPDGALELPDEEMPEK